MGKHHLGQLVSIQGASAYLCDPPARIPLGTSSREVANLFVRLRTLTLPEEAHKILPDIMGYMRWRDVEDPAGVTAPFAEDRVIPGWIPPLPVPIKPPCTLLPHRNAWNTTIPPEDTGMRTLWGLL